MTSGTVSAASLRFARARAISADYVRLLKPRVMALAVFTAFAGLLAARAPIGPAEAVVAMLCIAAGAGGAGALNMACDADIDAVMRRTRGRPVPCGRVRPRDAAIFGAVLSLAAVSLMASFVNGLSAAVLAFTIAFYAGIYTLWLKRRTPQNIVIGGLAGALPPLVGWTAAAGSASLNAWLLVAIIFVWTPPHFWSLALYKRDDYAKAGVPMMPLVRGAAHTRRLILAYSLVLAPLCLAPVFTGLGGPIYLAAAGVGVVGFLDLSIQLALARAGDSGASGDLKPSDRPARDLFRFSILFLFLLFASIVIECLLGLPPLTATL